MTEWEITKYEKHEVAGRGTVLSVHKGDNHCEDIEVGDQVLLDIGEFEVTAIEQMMKSFGITGDNIGLLVKSVEPKYSQEVINLCEWAWDSGYTAGCSENYDEDSRTFEDWKKENLC